MAIVTKTYDDSEWQLVPKLEATAGDVYAPYEADNNDSWIAGINLPDHSHAIECFGWTKEAVISRRDAVLAALAQPAASVPDALSAEQYENKSILTHKDVEEIRYAQGWNDCRAEMLKAKGE